MKKEKTTDLPTKDNKFVPAYDQKGESNKTKQTKKNKMVGVIPTKFKAHTKLTVLLILGVVLIIAIISLIIWGISEYQKYKYYAHYEKDMKALAFDIAYDNKTCKTNQSVTKSEAVKMMVVAFFNTTDITGFASTPVEPYENAIYVQYAEDKGIVPKGEITVDNEDKKIKYEDVLRYLGNAKMKVMDKPLDASQKEKTKDIANYNPDVQNAIADLVNNEIIAPRGNKVRGNKNVFKGQINEIVVNVANKYNTVTLGENKVNINPDKVPSNAEEYPYTLSQIDKSIYEKPFSVDDNRYFLNPVGVFGKKKDYFSRIQETVEKYYETLLNVNENTITAENFHQGIEEYVAYKQDNTQIEAYVDYVKKHHITLQGKAEVIMPAIYYDGRNYRARVKLTFEVKSADTKSNLLYLDSNMGNIVYDATSYTVYVDAYLGNALGGDSTLFMKDVSVFSSLLDPATSQIHQEKVGG